MKENELESVEAIIKNIHRRTNYEFSSVTLNLLMTFYRNQRYADSLL
jgi:hypothetical protein